MYLLVSFVILILGAFSFSDWPGTLLLVATQLVLLIGFIRERHVTSVGAFVFMSFLFFGMRPLYIVGNNDTNLIIGLFGADASADARHVALTWAASGLWVFVLGCAAQRMQGNWKIGQLQFASYSQTRQLDVLSLPPSGYLVALLLQGIALTAMIFLSKSGLGIYGSSLGAYAYDFPMILQGVQLFGIVVFVERWVRERSMGAVALMGVSFILLALTSWFAHDVTLFRGAYITPLMAAGFALLFRYKGRVGYLWLILPLIVLLPIFRILGETRGLENKDFAYEMGVKAGKLVNPVSYWNFFDSGGDMNIYDTFVAADQYKPAFHPYILSWLYAPAHVIPRKIWPSKPERGVLQDLTYLNGYPYCPGIMGFFLGDGGHLWMLGSMFILGFILSWMDMKVLRMKPGYFKICIYAILTVNALYLTRFFLWQYTWQVLYFLLPCWFLARYIVKYKGSFRNRQLGQPGGIQKIG